MYQAQYVVDKTTDTFADTAARIWGCQFAGSTSTGQWRGCDSAVRDDGSVFVVSLTKPLPEGCENLSWFCSLPFIQTKSKKPPDDWLGPLVNYDAERHRNTEYFAARKQLPKEARRAGATLAEFPALAQVEALKPRRIGRRLRRSTR